MIDDRVRALVRLYVNEFADTPNEAAMERFLVRHSVTVGECRTLAAAITLAGRLQVQLGEMQYRLADEVAERSCGEDTLLGLTHTSAEIEAWAAAFREVREVLDELGMAES